jgi:hypothetical protein
MVWQIQFEFQLDRLVRACTHTRTHAHTHSWPHVYLVPICTGPTGTWLKSKIVCIPIFAWRNWGKKMSPNITSLRYKIRMKPLTPASLLSNLPENLILLCESPLRTADGQWHVPATSRHVYVAFPWPRMRSSYSEPFSSQLNIFGYKKALLRDIFPKLKNNEV